MGVNEVGDDHWGSVGEAKIPPTASTKWPTRQSAEAPPITRGGSASKRGGSAGQRRIGMKSLWLSVYTRCFLYVCV